MNNPWDLKKDDSRIADSLPTFIIFCEDTISEPLYFQFFETEAIKINTVDSQKSKITNVVNALCHCRANGLMENESGEEHCIADGTQIWCVFDRDAEGDNSVEKGNVEFDVAIKSAEDKGIKVAWSNDSFELWILMHLEDIDITDDLQKQRETYYDRLSEIFKNLPKPNEYLSKALVHPTFSYKKDLKSKKNFRYIVRNEIVSKVSDAIARAKLMQANFDDTRIPYHEMAPCTKVHELVEELIKVGGKKI